MKRDGGFLHQVTRRLDFSQASISGIPLAEILGDSRVLIEGHRGITQYEQGKICVRVKFGCYIVCGSDLELRHMTRETVVISGKIDMVTLTRRNQ